MDTLARTALTHAIVLTVLVVTTSLAAVLMVNVNLGGLKVTAA